MRILLIPVGSAGDVLPFVGLGRALAARAHDATLLANAHFEPFAARAGLPFVPFGSAAEYDQLTRDPRLWRPGSGTRFILRRAAEAMPAHLDAIAALVARSEEPPLLVASTLALAARVAQEAQRVPLATVHLSPSIFRTLFEVPRYSCAVDPGRWPRFVKRLWWALADRAIDGVLARPVNALRARFGLRPERGILGAWLNSPQLVLGLFPPWFGPPQPDWPRALRLTGFPLFDGGTGAAPAPAAEGAVVVTPGSAMRHGEAFFREAAAACAALGRRALLVTPYREQLPKPLPPGTEQVDYAPFGTLFRSAAAVVHHGGIGTTAQALKAGVPQLVMPMAHDQPDNAARLERLGVGAWIAPRRFSAGRVAGALERLLGSEAVRTRCTEIARRFDGTGGLDAACEALEACAREVGDPDPRRYPPRSDR